MVFKPADELIADLNLMDLATIRLPKLLIAGLNVSVDEPRVDIRDKHQYVRCLLRLTGHKNCKGC